MSAIHADPRPADSKSVDQIEWPGVYFDAIGTRHRPAPRDPRIVSLVPSLTELLCDLGLTSRIVGRTGYCIHPRHLVNAIPKIGGTKSINVTKIERLAPTHLICNIDENEEPTVREIGRFVRNVLVTHPIEVADNRGLFHLLGGVFGRHAEALGLMRRFDDAMRLLRRQPLQPQLRVVYAIWRDPWMTISADTYIARMLDLAGLELASIRTDTTRRYPSFDFEQVDWSQVDALLLSTEPYRFDESAARELRSDPRLAATAVEVVDGELISWYGSRAIAGLQYMAPLRERLCQTCKTRRKKLQGDSR
jgi:ABC-type Fe3+-hydroxamate transport system substrate-binding protein